MVKGLLLLLQLLSIGFAHADIYKWTDSNGTVHFSDIPHSGAKKILLPSDKSSSSPTDSSPNKLTEQASQQDEQKEHTYNGVSIKEPKAEATIRNNRGYIPVIIEVDPSLMEGDLVQLILDGNALGKPQTSLLFALNEVNRGTHTLAAQIVDQEGNVLSSSEAITVYMQRPRVGMVPGTRPH